jgi:hypothetical protein
MSAAKTVSGLPANGAARNFVWAVEDLDGNPIALFTTFAVATKWSQERTSLTRKPYRVNSWPVFQFVEV